MSIKNIQSGMASILNIFGQSAGLRNIKTPDGRDWSDDCESIRSDWENIGNDIFFAINVLQNKPGVIAGQPEASVWEQKNDEK